jgi:RNA polymerase sigma-70 factor (ECF subfamily)
VARDTISEENLGSSSGLSLADRLRAGSPAAWRDLVELYGPLLDRWCRAANVPPDSAPDVAQDVFLAAFRGFDRFDSHRADATFRGWLLTIARSRIIEYHRRQKGRHVATGGSTAQANLQSIIDSIPIDDPTEPDQASALLHRALEQLRSEFTGNTWELFWRAAVLDHPTDLIAKENGVTSAAVRQAKSRVLRRLRKHLGDV